MPGTFDALFDDNAPMGFFGGYRPQYQSVLATLGGAPNANQVTQVTENAATPGANGTGGAVPNGLTYPNGSPVVDVNTGQPYPQPDRLNMQNNIATGKWIKAATELPGGDLGDPDLMMAMLFPHGSFMDYQRPLGHREGPFDPANTNVSAYNFGVVGAAAGYNLDRLLKGAGQYNLSAGNPTNAETEYGLSKERLLSIRQGYDDYKTGRWAQAPQSVPNLP